MTDWQRPDQISLGGNSLGLMSGARARHSRNWPPERLVMMMSFVGHLLMLRNSPTNSWRCLGARTNESPLAGSSSASFVLNVGRHKRSPAPLRGATLSRARSQSSRARPVGVSAATAAIGSGEMAPDRFLIARCKRLTFCTIDFEIMIRAFAWHLSARRRHPPDRATRDRWPLGRRAQVAISGRAVNHLEALIESQSRDAGRVSTGRARRVATGELELRVAPANI